MYIPRNPDEQSTAKRMMIPRESGWQNHGKRPDKQIERRCDLNIHPSL